MYTQRTKEELEDLEMPKHVIKAFLKLQEMGIACMTWDGGDRGHFWIWCEGLTDETELNIDYYGKYWGSDRLNKVLSKNGLYFEWDNPAVACVFDE